MGRAPKRLLDALFPQFSGAAWSPPADVYRTRDGWMVKFDLAGVEPEDFELRVRGRCLELSGVRRDWCIAEDQVSYSMEIAYSRFERTIDLPSELDDARITVEYRNGMLLVQLQPLERRP